MIRINLLFLKKNLKKIYNFILDYINYYWNYNEEKKLYKKLSKLTKKKTKYIDERSSIVDAHFYNFGYFYRLQLIRKATESYLGREVGLISHYNQKKCNSFLRNIGISKVEKMPNNISSEASYKAKKIFNKIKKAEDILEIEFPHKVPAKQFYDYVLKKQMLGKVNVKDENIQFYISEYIQSIRFAERLIDDYKPQKIFMSHAISVQCSPLCWIAPNTNIEVFTLFGNFGVPRFVRFKNPKDINFGIDVPSRQDLNKLNPNQIELLYHVGSEYLKKRLQGQTNDIGGKMAYDSDLQDIKTFIKNRNNKPIIVIYAHCWFDCPHAFGMDRFRDFEDWILTTYQSILNNTDFVWLFRPHPVEEWYGGITLKDILPDELPDHIHILPKKLSGKVVMKIASGLITYHGTAGIEYASSGKPVMVADKGWYHNSDFVLYPESREDYINLLSKNWLQNINQENIKRNAKIFAGLYFCCPSWQKKLIMPHDVNRREVKDIILGSLESKSDFIKEEINNIKKWIDSDSLGYHTFNILNADNFSISNTI